MLSNNQLFIFGLLAVTTAMGAPRPATVTAKKNGTVGPAAEKSLQDKSTSSWQRISRWCKKKWAYLTFGLSCFALLLFKIKAAKDKQMSEGLLNAVNSGNSEAVQSLIKAKVDVNRADGNSDTPLHRAVVWGRIKIAQDLMENGASVNEANSCGYTPLHLAAAGDCVEIAQALLQAKADANQVDHQNNTPLGYATAWDHKDVAQVLLAHKADINLQNKNGKNPLKVAQNKDTATPEEIMKQQEAIEQVQLIGGKVNALMQEFDVGPWNTQLQEIDGCDTGVWTDANADRISGIVESLMVGWRVVQKARQELQLAADSGCLDYSGRLDTQAGKLVVQIRKLIAQMRKVVGIRAEKIGLAILKIADIEKKPKGDPIKELPRLGAIKELAAEISRAFEEPISTNFEVATKLRQLSQDVNKCFVDCCRSLETQARGLQEKINRGYADQRNQEELREIRKVQQSPFYEKPPSESSCKKR